LNRAALNLFFSSSDISTGFAEIDSAASAGVSEEAGVSLTAVTAFWLTAAALDVAGIDKDAF
jgi:hypothetical protein